MLKYGILESRLFVIYNSLNYDQQLRVRNNLSVNDIFVKKFKNVDPVVIFTGRLQNKKKINLILEAQKKLIFLCPFNLVLVGDGPIEAGLRQMADDLNLIDRVWFYGPCYNEDIIGNLFYNSTLTISPGNAGLTAIHSMMYGTPVISHNNAEHQMPEYEAIKQYETGLLFKENDVSDLAFKIKHWLTIDLSKEIIRKKCFEIVDNYYNPYYAIKVMKRAIKQL